MVYIFKFNIDKLQIYVKLTLNKGKVMDKNIKQIRKNFNRNSKILAKYFKHFYKIKDDDIDFFCYQSYRYDYLEKDEQEELEKLF